jgi:hypothetical protein
MPNAFVSGIRKAFPFISAAASLGGPFGIMAANVVGKAIGADKSPDPSADSISNAIASAMASPEQRQALLQAERDFQLEMAELGYKNAEDLEKIAADDRASARNREVQVKDWMPKALGLSIMGGFLAAVFLLLTGHGKVESAMAGALVGYLSAKAELVAGYYFGSSAGSAAKDQTISTIASK